MEFARMLNKFWFEGEWRVFSKKNGVLSTFILVPDKVSHLW